jgi:hypothetical protein
MCIQRRVYHHCRRCKKLIRQGGWRTFECEEFQKNGKCSTRNEDGTPRKGHRTKDLEDPAQCKAKKECKPVGLVPKGDIRDDDDFSTFIQDRDDEGISVWE